VKYWIKSAIVFRSDDFQEWLRIMRISTAVVCVSVALATFIQWIKGLDVERELILPFILMVLIICAFGTFIVLLTVKKRN